MSIKKRCFEYCNGCDGKNSGWKIVELEPGQVDASSFDCSDFKQKKVYEPERDHNCDCVDIKRDCFDKKKKCGCEKKNDNCCEKKNFVCTLISVKNPDTSLIIPPDLNGQLPNPNVSVDLTNWSDLAVDAIGAFDNQTGTYTVPCDGDYQIELVVNFKTSIQIPISPTLDNVPTIEIYDVCTGQRILGSIFPTISIIVPIPPFTTGDPGTDVSVTSILSTGQVIIKAIVPLKACQHIRVRALTNGLTFDTILLPPPIASIDLSPTGVDTTLGIYKLRNSPIIHVDCNNY